MWPAEWTAMTPGVGTLSVLESSSNAPGNRRAQYKRVPQQNSQIISCREQS